MQVEPRDSFNFHLTRDFRIDRGEALFDELKRPVKAPDVAPAVMSRLGRAMPGITGRNGGRQAWAWRSGIAAALALASGLGIWYGHMQEQRRLPVAGESMPHIADVMRSIESDVEPSRNAFAAMFEAVNHVASHVEPIRDTDADATSRKVDDLSERSRNERRFIFPVDEKYWSMYRGPELGPSSPVHPDGDTGSPSEAEKERSNRDEWQETHSDDSSNDPVFRFTAGLSRQAPG